MTMMTTTRRYDLETIARYDLETVVRRYDLEQAMFRDRYDRDEADVPLTYAAGYMDGVNDALDAALAVTEDQVTEALGKIEKTCNKPAEIPLG